MSAVAFEAVDIVFGDKPHTALPLMERGLSREQILAETGQVLGVSNCTLAVEKGQICVLMGLSGSGKSTLLRAVNGLNKVVRGAVRVDDGGSKIDVATCDATVLRRLRMQRVAMVFQQFALLPWRTVAENVALGLELRGTPKAERDRIVKEKLALVHLEKWAGKFAHELSGGMQQRVGLARAFATDADILLMDEPFSALDPLIRDKLQDDLLELQQSLHKTIVFVSHDLDEALKIGSRVAIMEAGRIVQFGPPEDIVTKPTNDYVRQFVGSMNPLNVLTGGILMRPAAELVREGPLVLLDRAGRCRCRLDGNGHPVDLTVDGAPGRFVAFADGLDVERLPADCMVTGTPETRMRAAIVVRQTTRRPMVLLGPAGELVGVVGEHELYRGMLKQTDLALAPAAAAAP